MKTKEKEIVLYVEEGGPPEPKRTSVHFIRRIATSLFKMIIWIAVSHHSWKDGTGYNF
ncbi:MAG: hypothetical protein LBN21_12675 [Treponema sp.]|jgi:hypothetical protein|nr:hypothetical protein [Treponema sp.]